MSCTTTAEPLSAGLMVMSLFLNNCLMASLSFLVRLSIFWFLGLMFATSVSLSIIIPSMVGGDGGCHKDLVLNLWCLKGTGHNIHCLF